MLEIIIIIFAKQSNFGHITLSLSTVSYQPSKSFPKITILRKLSPKRGPIFLYNPCGQFRCYIRNSPQYIFLEINLILQKSQYMKKFELIVSIFMQ